MSDKNGERAPEDDHKEERASPEGMLDLPQATAQQLIDATSAGVRWLTVLQIATILMQFAFVAISSRLLAPEEFGAFTVAAIFLRLVTYFAELGLGSAVIQAKEMPVGLFRQLTAAALLAGLILYAAAALLSPAAGAYAQNQKATAVVSVLAISFVTSGVGVCHLAWLRRDNNFRGLALAEGSSYAVGFLLVGTVAAWTGAGALSLALAVIAQSGWRSALAIRLSGLKWRIALPRATAKGKLGFGAGVSLVGFTEFWASNMDTALIARYIGSYGLGQYNRANSIVAMPATNLTSLLTRALLPGFARSTDTQAGRGCRAGLAIISGLVTPLLALLAVCSTAIVDLLLGPQWAEAQKVLPFMCIAVLFTTMNQVLATTAEGRGLVRTMLFVQVGQLVVVAGIGLLLVLTHAPVAAYAGMWALGESVRWIAYLFALSTKIQLGVVSVFSDFAFNLLLGGVVAVPALILRARGAEEHFLIPAAIASFVLLLPLMLRLVARWPFRRELVQLNLLDQLPGARLRAIAWRIVK